jgi:hypothetical protein
MFSCNVLRCGVCLGCNFLVDSCSNAFFFILILGYAHRVFDKMSHSLLH